MDRFEQREMKKKIAMKQHIHGKNFQDYPEW